MSDITIVTAFFDIGRGKWSQSIQKNGVPLPHYLERTTDTYIERFEYMTKLDNDIIVLTSPELAPRLEQIVKNRAARIIVVSYNLDEFAEQRSKIEAIQINPEFVSKIHPQQLGNPEYWNPDYVLVTSLKAHFVAEAIDLGLVNTQKVAWLDFGYCRSRDALAGSTSWNYDFEPSKIHFWNCQIPNDPNSDIAQAIFHNLTIIHGAMVVANRTFWPALAEGMRQNLDTLIANGLVDDDQGLWLMCYHGNPNAFELHPVDYYDPFIVFRDYNTHA